MNNQFILSIALLIFFAIKCQSIVEDPNDTTNDNIDITEAPFALSLRLNGSHVCGGAIISNIWGITAAHCIVTDNELAQNYSVRSGSTYREYGGFIHNLTKIIIHDKYNPTNSDYDIAIFMIEPTFNFSLYTQPIVLPTLNSVKNNWGNAIGWGAYSIYNETILSDNLRCVKLPLIEREKCIEDYDGYFDVTPRQLCYGYENGGTDTCKGDSGGPLFNSDKILIGITSWGDECGEKYSPGVYTNVQMMTDWIKYYTDI